jgi:hypothetical protein
MPLRVERARGRDLDHVHSLFCLVEAEHLNNSATAARPRPGLPFQLGDVLNPDQRLMDRDAFLFYPSLVGARVPGSYIILLHRVLLF